MTYYVEWYRNDRRFRSPTFSSLSDALEYQTNVLDGAGRVYCDD